MSRVGRRPLPLSMTGYSLIEVLVSLVILALGLLALAGMQLVAMRTSSGSFFRSQAAVIAEDLRDRMAANAPGAAINYELADANTPPAAASADCSLSTATCNPQQIAEWDLSQWYAGANAVLPSFRATVSCNTVPCGGNSIYTITVMWDEPDPDGVQATGTGCNPANTDDRFCYRLSLDP